jgi:ribosome maturation protein Sdo1
VSRASKPRTAPRKPCCMISEILEEAGVDRDRLRQVRRQVLEGVILMCQWQLQRMEEPTERRSPRKPRKVTVE